MITVLICDDAPIIRMGLRMTLEAEADLRAVGEAATGQQAFDESVRLRPDVVLLDIQMPSGDGITATEKILSARPETKVLILTTFERTDYLHGALRAGASGFLIKDSPPERVLAAIRSVAEGNAELSPSMTRALLDTVASSLPRADEPSPFRKLTEQETALLRELAAGRSNTECAQALGLSHATVKTYVSRLLAKVGARDRAHLVAMTNRYGIPR